MPEKILLDMLGFDLWLCVWVAVGSKVATRGKARSLCQIRQVHNHYVWYEGYR